MTQSELLSYVLTTLETLRIEHMVVGSVAGGVYGEPRFTNDIDIVLELTPGQINTFCVAFPAPDYYLSEPAVRDAVRHRFQFNVLHPESGNKIDFMFPSGDAWGRSQFQRRRRVSILVDQEGFAASPEDVIISKLRYYAEGGSDKHLRDIAGILRVSGDLVNRDEVEKWSIQLGVDQIWHQVLRRVDAK